MYTAALIGLGDIAWRYDHRMPGSMLTHYSAYQAHPDVRVIAGYDPHEQARHEFCTNLSVDVHEHLDEVLTLKPDIASITSPTEFHAQHLACCLHAKIPMVWLEKPAANTYAELLDLIELQESLNATTVLVGFQRRYLSVYRRLKDVITKKSLGECVCLSIIYSRGLLTNGIHLVDLLQFLCEIDSTGEIAKLENNGAGESPSFIYKTQNLECTITGLDIDHHSIDITAHFTAGRIQILHGGLTEIVEEKISNKHYPGFSHLTFKNSQPRCQQALQEEISCVSPVLLEDLIKSHCSEKLPTSNLRTSLVAQAMVERVLQ